MLLRWHEDGDERIKRVGHDLSELGLTWKVEPRRLDDARVALRVGRLPRAEVGGARDLVSIADVGFGASQVLPVVVALHAAAPGQLVHIEQPEIHLHPNAQVKMAELLLAAARRGVKVVVETHSAVLLKRIQVAVAKDEVAPETVALHWFRRNEAGSTKVTTEFFDDRGSYGAWPVDFAEVERQVDRDYLDAVMAKELS